MINSKALGNLQDVFDRQQDTLARLFDSSAALDAAINQQKQLVDSVMDRILEYTRMNIPQMTISESVLSHLGVTPTINREIIRQATFPAVEIVNQAMVSSLQALRLPDVVSEFHAHIGQVLSRITSESLASFNPLIDMAERIGKTSAIRDAFVHYNLWIAPSMTEELVGKILDFHQDGLNSGTVHSMLVRHYAADDWKALDEVIESCEENPLFEPRIHLINEALDAHRLGLYNASVSMLLMQVEGIAADYVKKHNLMPQLGGKTREIILTAVKNTPCAVSDVREYAGVSALVGYLEQAMYISMDFDKEHTRLQTEEHLLAHPIRHGRQVKFGTRTNSLRLFLILDVLSLLDG